MSFVFLFVGYRVNKTTHVNKHLLQVIGHEVEFPVSHIAHSFQAVFLNIMSEEKMRGGEKTKLTISGSVYRCMDFLFSMYCVCRNI